MLKDLRVISKFPDNATLKMPIGVLKDFVKNFALACGIAFKEDAIEIDIVLAEDEIKINTRKAGTNLIHIPQSHRRF